MRSRFGTLRRVGSSRMPARAPLALLPAMPRAVAPGPVPRVGGPPQQQQQQQQQPRAYWSQIRRVARDILRGDDHVNPKKLLERRYVYLSLLALELRRRRRADPHADKAALYAATVEALDRTDPDATPNAGLRERLQAALHPQVVELFGACCGTDRRLAALLDPLEAAAGADGVPDPLDAVDWDRVAALLQDELTELTAQPRTEAKAAFRDRKEHALRTLLAFHASGDVAAAAAMPPGRDAADAFGVDTTGMPAATARRLRQYQSLNLVRAARLRDDVGYAVLALRSAIPGAGRGLFVDGTAVAGSIVAFQPGEVWPKEHLLTTDPDVLQHFADDEDCHISLRFDDYVVDSRLAPVTVLLGREAPCRNPFALGHMVNHPAPGTRPNCRSTMLDFTERLLKELADTHGEAAVLPYVPNTYAREPGWKSRAFYAEPIEMHGICLLASQDVCDQELVYDYRLQSDVTPEWYTPAQSGIMEDEQVVFFRDDWMDKSNK